MFRKQADLEFGKLPIGRVTKYSLFEAGRLYFTARLCLLKTLNTHWYIEYLAGVAICSRCH